jgi:hypothetical protein
MAAISTAVSEPIFGLTAPSSPATAIPYADSVAIGDVTGDGRDDLILATQKNAFYPAARGEVTIFVQGADGQLSPVSYSYESTAVQTSLALGDLDNDGTKDIIVGHDTGITIFLSDGQGHFGVQRHTSVGPNIRLVEVMDADRDGSLDIAAVDSVYAAQPTLRIFLGDGAGSILSSRVVSTLPNQPQDMRVADVTGDSAPDIILSNTEVTVFPHNGIDGFNEPAHYPSKQNWPYSGLAIADFNGDGLNDVAVGEAKNSPTQVWIYSQKTDGKLAEPAALSTYDVPTSLVAHDLDRDGREDLVVTHSGWASVGYYTQQSGAFGTETRFTVQASRETRILAAGDLNGDGCGDVAMVNPRTTLSLMWGYNCKPLAPVVTRRDIDADGKTDMLWRNAPKTHWVYWLMSGGERLGGISYAVGPDWDILASADFDGNGHEDLIWSNGTHMQMWLGGATGYTGQAMGNFPTGYRVVAVGDLDGDGNSDLVWRDASNNIVAVWFMSGADIIGSRADMLGNQWRIAGIGDLTRDRRQDLIVASDTRMMLWQANPNRTFTPVAMGGYPTGWQLVDAADINGDGFADLLWRHSGQGYFVYWTMRGPRRTSGVQFAVDGTWNILQTGDHTGDGLADVVWTNGSVMQLWASDGYSFSGAWMPDYPQGWSLVR